MVSEKLRGRCKLLDGHSLVQAREGFWMRRFQAHRDLQLPVQHISEMKHPLVDQGRMRLDDDTLKAADRFSYRSIVFHRYGSAVEKASTVVELDLIGWRKLGERKIDLLWNGADRDGFLERVLPQIAHQ